MCTCVSLCTMLHAVIHDGSVPLGELIHKSFTGGKEGMNV